MRIWREAKIRYNTITKDRDDERGAVLFLLLMCLFVFLAVAAVAVDLSSLATRGQSLQNTADSAALAGVTEYQQQRLRPGVSNSDAESFARDVIRDIVRANGVTITPVSTFDSVTGRVTVSITDPDPDAFLVTVVGVDPEVQRQATAEFLACPNACPTDIEIKRPFSSVSAAGQGDGYKPIAVRQPDDLFASKIYAINHNSESRNIVCVDRETQGPCWNTTARVAYSNASLYNEKNPEMPQTAVVGTRIYWSASDESGHRLFCWDAADGNDFPCPTTVQLSGVERADSDHSPVSRDKDENRGGGTFGLGGKVFAFTDNHEIHCWDPVLNGYCAGYNGQYGSLPTQLDEFRDNFHYNGNHGSSIDRIINEDTGKVYSTIHINTAPPKIQCVTPLDANGVINRRVVIRNVDTGRFMVARALPTEPEVLPSLEGTVDTARWDIRRDGDGGNGLLIRTDVNSEYLDADAGSGIASTTVSLQNENEWELINQGSQQFQIESQLYGGFLIDDGADIYQSQGSGVPDESLWEFLPWQCGDPEYDLIPTKLAPFVPDDYAAGTWVHCFDTGVVSGTPEPCNDFDRFRIHPDSTRFSGRLFFYRGQRPDPDLEDPPPPPILGVCSSGYGNEFSASSIEVNCLDLQGNPSSTLSGGLAGLRNSIRASTGSRPGAWGDPHWNESENRLLYPTEHDTSLVICWDFDSGGQCGSRIGQAQIGETTFIDTEDYGFFSEGDCVFGLGHNAYFWAFKASNIEEPCDSAPGAKRIFPCPCGTALKWGRLDFTDLDTTDFLEFRVQVRGTGPGTPVLFPANGQWWDLLSRPQEERIIDLSANDIDPAVYPALDVVVFVRAENDPFGPTALPPRFVLTFPQLPHLVE